MKIDTLEKQQITVLILALGFYTVIVCALSFILGQTLATITYENILNTEKILNEKNISTDRICITDNKTMTLGYCMDTFCQDYTDNTHLISEAQADKNFIDRIDIYHNLSQEEIF